MALTNDGVVVEAPNEATIVEAPAADTITAQPNIDENAPPAEVDEKSNIDFDAFNLAKEANFKPEVKPVKESTEKPEDTEKPVEEPKVEKVVEKPEVTPAKQPAVVKQSNARDFTGIEEADVPLFKSMSNDAFNKLKPVYLERKKLAEDIKQKDTRISDLEKGKIPDSYYENPQAYVLTPDFLKATNDYSNAQQLSNHWLAQLNAVRDGSDKFQDIEQGPDGKLHIVEKSALKSEAYIIQQISDARQYFLQAKSTLQNLSTQHQTKHQESVNYVQQKEAEFFPAFEKPEYKEQYTPVIEDTIKKFPPAFQKSPLIRMLAKSLITNFELKRMIDTHLQKTNGQAATPAKVQIQRQAGPTSGDTGVEVPSGNKGEITAEDFERYKRGE